MNNKIKPGFLFDMLVGLCGANFLLAFYLILLQITNQLDVFNVIVVTMFNVLMIVLLAVYFLLSK